MFGPVVGTGTAFITIAGFVGIGPMIRLLPPEMRAAGRHELARRQHEGLGEA